MCEFVHRITLAFEWACVASNADVVFGPDGKEPQIRCCDREIARQRAPERDSSHRSLRSCVLGSSATVSPEVRRPGSNKIMILGGDWGDRSLKWCGKFWAGFSGMIPFFSGISAMAFLKYAVSMTETPQVRPCQESRHLSIPSDRAESPRRQARKAIRHRNPRSARHARRQRRHRPTPARRGSFHRARHGARRTLLRCTRFPRHQGRLGRLGTNLRTSVASDRLPGGRAQAAGHRPQPPGTASCPSPPVRP